MESIEFQNASKQALKWWEIGRKEESSNTLGWKGKETKNNWLHDPHIAVSESLYRDCESSNPIRYQAFMASFQSGSFSIWT